METAAQITKLPPTVMPPLSDLPERSFGSLFLAQPPEQLAANEALFWEGDRAEHIFEVTDGVLRLFKVLPDGRRAITGFLFPGDVLGLAYRDKYLCTAEAVAPTKVRRFRRSQFQAALGQSPELGRQLFAMMCDELSAAQDQVLLLGRKNAQERVASFLLAVARKLRAADSRVKSVILPMLRQDMADYLGLTIETVSRVMSRLRADGVIALPDPQRLVIRDYGALRRLSGEEQEAAMAVTVQHRAAWPH